MSASQSRTTEIAVGFVSASVIVCTYNTLPGNQPNIYRNTVFLWMDTETISYDAPPLAAQTVGGNAPSGSVAFPLDIQLEKQYLVAYAVGPNASQICSWAHIPATTASGGQMRTNLSGPANPTGSFTAALSAANASSNLPSQIPLGESPAGSFQTRISMDYGPPNSAVVTYYTPDGNTPQASGQWIGLFYGPVALYTTPAIARVDIASDDSTGQIPVPCTLLRGMEYTLAYFMSGDQTSAAATFTFQT